MAKQQIIQFYRGNKASLPTSGLTAFEPILASDSHELFIATAATTTIPIAIDLNALTELAATPASGDWLYVYDISEAGVVKCKKVLYSNVQAGAGATVDLDNLAGVSINESLVSDTDITDDLGTGDVRWKDAWISTLNSGLTVADTLKLRARDVDGTVYVDILTITSANDVTADLNALVTIGGNSILDDTSTVSVLTTIGTVTSGGLGTGAVIAGVTMTLGSDADGDIYFRSSNVLTRLAKGAAFEVLQMNSAATAPEWTSILDGRTF